MQNRDLEAVLFLDIETVPLAQNAADLSPTMLKTWVDQVARRNFSEDDAAWGGTGLMAEFGKIVCLSVGRFVLDKESRTLRFKLRSFAHDSEADLLRSFCEWFVERRFDSPEEQYLCAHNGIGFDFPFLARRLIINQLPLPRMFDMAGNKSWANTWLIDTMELWSFGDYRHNMGLSPLAASLGLPSPKEDINGADVASVYYNDADLRRICEYCQRDVLTTARILQRIIGADAVPDEAVDIAGV